MKQHNQFKKIKSSNSSETKTVSKFSYVFLWSVLFSLSFTSCLDVIEVDLEEATPRVVIDAALQWERDTDGNIQEIKVSKTRGFFDDTPSFIENAFVQIEDEEGNVFSFEEVEAGIYRTENFQPILNRRYFLSVEAEGEVFESEEVMTSVPTIAGIEQTDDGGFAGGQNEVRVFFEDPAGEENFYLFKFFVDFLAFPDFTVLTDEFIDGNVSSVSFSDEDLEVGDVVTVQMHGISRSYYNFLFRLLAQTGAAGGPFQAQPATVRGNIVNKTNDNNFAFGYFSLSEMIEIEVEVGAEN